VIKWTCMVYIANGGKERRVLGSGFYVIQWERPGNRGRMRDHHASMQRDGRDYSARTGEIP
jgi:hypothetical protein